MPSQETIKGQLTLLDTYRKRLVITINQQARMGNMAPAYMQLEIDEARAQIAKIKAYLRQNSIAVDDAPEDEDRNVAELPAPQLPTRPDPLPAAQVSADQSASADVFVSYHPADKAWVRGELLPRLDRAGLRYIVDFRDFAIGAPKIINIENAVERSRHTLIVLTPDWLASDWNSFQGLLAQSTDPSSVEHKLLPLILKPARLPARIAYLEAIDLTDPSEQAFQIDRLIQSLVRSRENGSTPAATQPAVDQPKKPASVPTTADFVIITALEEERDAVLSHLPGNRRLAPSNEDIRTYRFASVPVTFPDEQQGSYTVAIMSLLGMGRIEASLATSDAIRRWNPRYVLMVGIAGGIEAEGACVGDVLISNQVIDYEVQKITVDGESIRYSGHRVAPRLLDAAHNLASRDWRAEITCTRPSAGQPKRLVGPVATGDKVIARRALLDKLRADWPKLIGVEMEAGGAAAAAFQSANAPGFFMVRGVSDLADEHKGNASVDEWREYACDVAAAYTVALLKSGPVPPK